MTPRQPDPYRRSTPGYRVRDMFPTREDGTCACGCGRPLPGPGFRWTTDDCRGRAYRLYEIRQGVAASVRAALLERDHGVCASCGAVCVMVVEQGVLRQTEANRHLFRSVTETGPGLHWDLLETCPLVREAQPELFVRHRRVDVVPWEGHHLVPVAEGGGGCDLDGYVTMCRACHAAETGALRRRLNRARGPQIELGLRA